MPNSSYSTYRVIMKTGAFPMDRGRYSLRRSIICHDTDAMACTPGRIVRLQASRSAVRWVVLARSTGRPGAHVVVICMSTAQNCEPPRLAWVT